MAEDHPNVARALIGAGARPGIFEATSLGDEALVLELLRANPTLANARFDAAVREDNPTAHTPLHIAARKNLPDIAAHLLDAGADLDARDAQQRTAVDQALARGHEPVFSLLVARGAAPDPALVAHVGTVARARGMVQLQERLFARELEPARALLEADPSLARAKLPTFWPDNYVGGTALHLAAWLDLRPFMDLLLEYGADVNARDERYGGTPVSWAEENGQRGAAEYLRAAAGSA